MPVPTASAPVCSFEGAPHDAPQCECRGGTPRGELGDGMIACGEGETELGRIQHGSAAGVCCHAVVPLAVAPLPLGTRGRRPALAIAEPYRGAWQQLATPRGFRGEIRLSDP